MPTRIEDGIAIHIPADADESESSSFLTGFDLSTVETQTREWPVAPSFLVLLLLQLLLTILLSVWEHKVSIILFAHHGGDNTIADKGYLKLDVLKYTHWLNSLVIPLVCLMIGGFGLPGGAVFVATSLLRSKRWETAVSLGGPLATLLFAILSALTYTLVVAIDSSKRGLIVGLAFNTFVNITAFILNLLPFPPLDGYGALRPWLPENITQIVALNYQMVTISCMIVIFLMFWKIPFVVDVILGCLQVFQVSPKDAVQGLSAFTIF